MDLESGLFRILDEALVAYLERSPDPGSRCGWTGPTRSRPGRDAVRDKDKDAKAACQRPPRRRSPTNGRTSRRRSAAMMEDRRADARDAAETARREAIVALPVTTWQEIESRAATLGIDGRAVEDGSELHLVAEAPIPTER